MAELSALTAKAQGQLLRMTRTQVTDDGLLFTKKVGGTRKRGMSTIVEWSPALRAVVDQLLVLKEAKSSLYVVANRDGKPYTASGFKAMWDRLMDAWIDDGRPKKADGQPSRAKPSVHERFQFHDLRARAVSKVKEQGREAGPSRDTRRR